ncbi:MAG TPA: RNA polymerase sigma factor [Pyrinomonadaceae bacterium]|nr:RNA polymerase sigma factor [Pyrinomonadaceae bacterium]
MLDPHRLIPEQETTREQEFTKRYDRLLGWALRLTNHQRASAEDLVQDAFIQFTRGRTSLDAIENLDGYLYRMLRNMHLSRVNRCAQQVQNKTVSIAERELDLNSQGLELQQRLQAHEELCRICQYACIRKESSRAGSVLILRFFHEYSPIEIAEVLCCSRHCVDQWQRFARREVKLYLEDPRRLKFVTAKGADVLPAIKVFGDRSLADDLRLLIFRSKQGECVSPEELKHTYTSRAADGLSTAKLAHIVSCRVCLDEANRVLGLPTLSQRYQNVVPDSKQPPTSGGSGGSGGGPTDVKSQLQRRLNEVISHKPKELHIAVNGAPVGSIKVASDLSELDLKLSPDESIDFVEILSEQGIQLLFFNLSSTVSATNEQWAQIELSEGRVLEARAGLQNGLPTVQITYSQTASVSEMLTDPEDLLTASDGQHRKESGLSKVRLLLASLMQAPWWVRPQFVTVLATIIAFGLMILLKPPLTGREVLGQATIAEARRQLSSRIVHRVIKLEERRAGELLSTHTIEIWEDSAKGQRARRVYDQTNVLVAGRWDQPDGTRIVYHHVSGLKSEDKLDTTVDSLLAEPWQLALTATEFAYLTKAADLGIVESTTSYEINFRGQLSVGGVKLLAATLTLVKPDLRAVQHTIELERDDTIYLYRLSEQLSERLTDQQQPAEYFMPDAFLSNPAASPEKELKLKSRNNVPSNALGLSNSASTELEIEVAYLLNRAKADRNEQITLTRTSSGSLMIEGVVDTEERKHEIEAALHSVKNNPLVRVDIQTVSQAANRTALSLPGRFVQSAPETANTIPVYEELREYLVRTQPALAKNGEVDEAVHKFSSELVNSAYRALFHAIELRGLKNRFSDNELRTVSPDARVKWLEMITRHAAAFESEVATVRRKIGPLLFAGATPSMSTENVSIRSDAELGRAIERLWKLAFATNGAIRDAFTISPQSSGVAVKSLPFWQSLIESGAVAAAIKQYEQ